MKWLFDGHLSNFSYISIGWLVVQLIWSKGLKELKSWRQLN